MMQVGLAFGPLLGRFLVDFGSKLGGKLEPSWHQNPKNWGTKTMSKNHPKNAGLGTTQETKVNDCLAPKILQVTIRGVQYYR